MFLIVIQMRLSYKMLNEINNLSTITMQKVHIF